MIDFNNLDKFSLDDFIKDTFIGFFQSIFYENQSEFRYDPDKEVTRLNISDQFSKDDLTPEFKPTIYIRRHPFSYVNTSIDQFFGAQGLAGTKAYGDLIAGSIEAVCVSSVELEACRLAGLVFLLTNQFKNELCAKAHLYRVEVKTLGEAQPIQVASTMRVVEVPVLIQVMFQYNWNVAERYSKPILNGIEIGRATDVVTGEPIYADKSVSDDCSGDQEGVDLETDKDGKVRICVPFSSIDS